jgi:hypothetical protein
MKKALIKEEDTFILYQNVPNPWNEQTDIGFYISAPENVTLELRDITGKVIFQKTELFNKGHNVWVLKKGNLPSGVFSYTLKYKDESKSNKMIIIE